MLLRVQGKLEEAEPLFRESLDGRRRTLGDTHRSTLISINNLGMLLKAQGKLTETEAFSREAVRGARETLGDYHSTTITLQKNLDGVLQTLEKS